MEKKNHPLFNLAVIVGALGYFVDIYDLLLFSILRIPSLKGLGLSADEIKVKGGDILMGHADYWDPNNDTILSIYQAAGVKTNASATTAPPIAPALVPQPAPTPLAAKLLVRH